MKILCTLDGSPESEAVLTAVRDFAVQAHAGVKLLTVLSDRGAAVARSPDISAVFASGAGAIFRDRTSALLRSAIDEQEAAAAQRNETWKTAALTYLSDVSVPLREAGIETDLEATVREDVAEAIVQCARDSGADIIAMTTHGYSGLAATIHGSVAGEVVRSSGLPVLLLRPQS